MKNRFLILVIVLLSSMSVFGNSVSDGGSYEYLSPVRIVYYSMSGERMSQTLDNMVVPFLKKENK